MTLGRSANGGRIKSKVKSQKSKANSDARAIGERKVKSQKRIVTKRDRRTESQKSKVKSQKSKVKSQKRIVTLGRSANGKSKVKSE
ncbi:MAG: hypothetical protein F6J93_22525 [Oscillatoria sp. SIO1A7]|nr:hypothetical protein [Oscillatoria sp. SIO1A7]